MLHVEFVGFVGGVVSGELVVWILAARFGWRVGGCFWVMRFTLGWFGCFDLVCFLFAVVLG